MHRLRWSNCHSDSIFPAAPGFRSMKEKLSTRKSRPVKQRGCYASVAIAPDLLAALRSGKQLKVSFQNLGKETITIPMPLADYAAAYDRIK